MTTKIIVIVKSLQLNILLVKKKNQIYCLVLIDFDFVYLKLLNKFLMNNKQKQTLTTVFLSSSILDHNYDNQKKMCKPATFICFQ
jgi:hypothetical protein